MRLRLNKNVLGELYDFNVYIEYGKMECIIAGYNGKSCTGKISEDFNKIIFDEPMKLRGYPPLKEGGLAGYNIEDAKWKEITFLKIPKFQARSLKYDFEDFKT